MGHYYYTLLIDEHLQMVMSAWATKKNKLKIKTASSDERALPVRVLRDLLLSTCAAVKLTCTTPSVSVFPMIWWAIPPVSIKNV